MIAFDRMKTKWFDAMVAKGHTPIVDEDGLNLFVLDEDIHNGPGCNVCHISFCMHCRGIKDIPECIKS